MSNIKISDLRKGNLVKTEHGILPVHIISFNDIQVKAKDGRVLWAKQFEGIPANKIELKNKAIEQLRDLLQKEFKSVSECDNQIDFVHEVQNWYYWNSGKKELEITI